MSRPLYLTSAVRQKLGPCLRPGGARLTRRILTLTRPKPSARIVDAGCGCGGGLSVFSQQGHNHLLGIDHNAELLREARSQGFSAIQADMAALPLEQGSVDLLVSECAWNLSDTQQSLAEFFRVLRPGAKLALADIFLRRAEQAHWPISSCFQRATSLDEVHQAVRQAGFSILHSEDLSHLLTQAAATFVFAHGSLMAFWRAVTGDISMAEQMCQSAGATRPGMFLLIGERSHG